MSAKFQTKITIDRKVCYNKKVKSVIYTKRESPKGDSLYIYARVVEQEGIEPSITRCQIRDRNHPSPTILAKKLIPKPHEPALTQF